MAWTQKIIVATIGSVTLQGLRMSVEIDQAGAVDAGATLNALIIYGMTKSQMNQLSNVGNKWNTYSQLNDSQKPTVTIQAGDKNGLSTIYSGIVSHAMIDAMSEPQVRFIVAGNAQAAAARKATNVISQPGAVQSQTLFQQIAQSMGFQLENNGVNAVIRNPYLWGTDITKMRHLAEAAKAQWCIDTTKGVVAVWPSGGGRQSQTPTISKKTGMVTSPSVQTNTIIVKTLFNPSIVFGAFINVQSDVVEAANGQWNVNGIHTELDCMVPRGRWFQTIRGVNPSPSGGSTASSGTASAGNAAPSGANP